MKMKASLTLLLAAFVALFATACRTPVAIDPQSGQQQTGYYTAGKFFGPLAADSGQVFRVAIRELDEMGYFRTGELHRESSISIYARKVGDEKVTLRVTQLAPGESELSIKVGTFGDLPESQRIYNAVRGAL